MASPSNQVNITNDSQAPGGGLLVTGTNQRVGAVNGAGNTVVATGAKFTANSIIQNSLVIGGSAGSLGTVTIQASDPTGAPLGTNAAATSGVDQSPFASLAAELSTSSLTSLNVDGASLIASAGYPAPVAAASFNSSGLSGDSLPVSANQTPEPSTAVLGVLAAIGVTAARRHLTRNRRLAG